jgi:hypothetical protein
MQRNVKASSFGRRRAWCMERTLAEIAGQEENRPHDATRINQNEPSLKSTALAASALALLGAAAPLGPPSTPTSFPPPR